MRKLMNVIEESATDASMSTEQYEELINSTVGGDVHIASELGDHFDVDVVFRDPNFNIYRPNDAADNPDDYHGYDELVDVDILFWSEHSKTNDELIDVHTADHWEEIPLDEKGMAQFQKKAKEVYDYNKDGEY